MCVNSLVVSVFISSLCIDWKTARLTYTDNFWECFNFAMTNLCGVVMTIIVFSNQIYMEGYISLGSIRTFAFDQDLTLLGSVIISPFWADIDTETTGTVYYR